MGGQKEEGGEEEKASEESEMRTERVPSASSSSPPCSSASFETQDMSGERDWLGPAFEAREVLKGLFKLW